MFLVKTTRVENQQPGTVRRTSKLHGVFLALKRRLLGVEI